MKKILLLFVLFFVFLEGRSQNSKNDFKIGIFGFENMTTLNNCCDINNQPITELIYMGHPSSRGNVLSADGFNIVINYEPNIYNSSGTYTAGLLELLRKNNLQFFANLRNFFRPNSNGIGGVNIYNNNGIGSNTNCKARPNFDDLFQNTYSSYKDVIWGHQMTEEASYFHWFNPSDNFYQWDDQINNLSVEVPPQNVSDAIGYFRQKVNSISMSNQKFVIMEAHHHMSIHDSTDDEGGLYNQQDYLKIANKPDVFLEGSYTQFWGNSWGNAWINENYADIFKPRGGHYLGPFKSIDYAYKYVNEVHKVIGIELNQNGFEKHYHSDVTIQNANWIWFQAYTSIIHGAKGIWFWDMNNSYAQGETIAKGIDRYELYNFPQAYQKFIRHLARELRYLVNKDILTSDNSNIIASKTDSPDSNGIVPDANSYIPSNLPTEKRTENYGLRYIIRSNNNEVVMIISNPLNVSVSTTLNFMDFRNQIIRNSTQVEFLFEDDSDVNSNTYKIDRNSNIDLKTMTVEKKRIQNFDGKLSLTMGPLDVHVIRFTGSNGWNDAIIGRSFNKVMPLSQLKFANGKLFYAREDGILHAICRNNTTQYTDNWLNPSSPKLRSAGGLDVAYENNNEVIYYVSTDNQIYRMFWNGSSWVYEKPLSTAMNVANYSELHNGIGQIFYVRNDGILHMLYKSNGTWRSDWITPSAPKVNANCGFEVVPQNNNDIFYVSTDSRIYRSYWNNGWMNEMTSSSPLYVREHSEMHYANGKLFYVRNDGILHALSKRSNGWGTDWLNPYAPKVKQGTGFVVVPANGDEIIYYIGEDSNIYRMNWDSSVGWVWGKLTLLSVQISGSKENMDMTMGSTSLFYVGDDSRVHNLTLVNNLPFSASGSTMNSGNSWDVQGSDGYDAEYLFYIPDNCNVNATVCDLGTNYDTKLEIFNINGTRTGFYNDDYSCTYNQWFSTINANLSPGYYYIIVDGYNGITGNYKLNVTSTSLKNGFSNNKSDYVLGDHDDDGKYDTITVKNLVNSEKKENSLITIYPNPASKTFHITSTTENIREVYLLDLKGIKISHINCETKDLIVPCDCLINGIYLVKVVLENHNYTYKINIKN